MWLDAWCTDLKIRGCSPRTIENWWYIVSAFGRSRRKAPSDIDMSDAIIWLSRGVSNSTIRSDWSAAHSFYDFAIRSRWIEVNPLAEIPMVKREKRQQLPAPQEAVDKGLKSPDFRVRRLIKLFDDTGVRRTEAALCHTKNFIGERGERALLVHGKGGKDRTVPLTQALDEFLWEIEDGWFFPGRVGHVHPDTIYDWTVKATGWSPHAFRRKFGLDLYRATGDVRKVQLALGHESLATTQQYIFNTGEEVRDAIGALSTYRRNKDIGAADPAALLRAFRIPAPMAAFIVETIREEMQRQPSLL
ncbi:MAG: tyrosine-type recombinase/integrase [Bifidobacteriaceae bacterium]|nr:tyrosine-type recombinase/integrase [Bifidobacteriaceae bacterium]